MTHTHTHRGIVWIDLENPDEQEITALVKRYDLNPLVGEELRSSSTLAKIDFYPGYVLVVLTLPLRRRSGHGYEIVEREVDFVIGKNFLITARYDTIEQLEYLAKIFETNAIVNRDDEMDHACNLFYHMVKRIYAGVNEDIENIKDSIISAETQVFGGSERKMVEVLSDLSRELIDFRQTARIHKEIWDDMIAHDPKNIFGADFIVCIRDIRDDFNRINELIGNARELITDLRETNDSLLNTRQNEIIKLLTLVAFIFQPLTFIAALFTIPAINVPIVQHGLGWYGIFIFMIVVSSGMWLFFKKKKWI